MKNYKGTELTERTSGVEVKVDVAKIVKYCCLAGIVIVGIIFGTETWIKYLELKKKGL
jgi:hypothetical protein